MKGALLPALLLSCSLACGVVAQEPPPVNPFKPRGPARPDARPGAVTLSDGETFSGQIYITRDKRLRIYDIEAKVYRDIPLVAVKEIDTRVEKEGIEKEWRWKEGGSDVKVFTGKSYPWREYITTITLTNDQKITGHLKATPVNVDCGGECKKLVVHGKNKGELGETLADLVYICKIVFDEPKEKAKE